MGAFSDLWKNYPDHSKMKTMCTNKQKTSNTPFDDYCAKMMSECFNRSGVNISRYKGAKCWSHSGKKHILLAEDLANGLRLHTPAGFGSLKKNTAGRFSIYTGW